MMKPSQTFTSPVLGAPGVDPRLLELLTPSSEEALIAAINQAIPPSPPCVDDSVMSPGLVSDDGNSQSSTSPPCTPQSYDFPSPQLVHNDLSSFYSPTTSSSSPTSSTARVLIEAPCAGGMPLKQEGGYTCSSCGKLFTRADSVQRHVKTTGMKVICKYCGKPASGERYSQNRHLNDNMNCWKAWEASYKAGRFTERTVEDAYN